MRLLQLLNQLHTTAMDLSIFFIMNSWDFTSFDSLNRFTKRNQPINADTMFVYDFESGNLTHRWGRNMFYMPHGVSVDHDGNIWLTDVAMHQVMGSCLINRHLASHGTLASTVVFSNISCL